MMRNRILGVKKAGLSGLFLSLLTTLTFAQPVKLTVHEVSVGTDERNGTPIVKVRLAEESRQALADVSRSNVGKAMDLRIDGKVVFAPVIREPLLEDWIVISGGLTAAQAADIVRRVTAGATMEVELTEAPR